MIEPRFILLYSFGHTPLILEQILALLILCQVLCTVRAGTRVLC